MPWRVVERRIGRAGGMRQREQRQREWDRRFGEGPISIRLSPLHIKAAGEEKMTLEHFWQSRKCLAVWD